MGKIADALKAAAQNGGRKTTVGGFPDDMNLSKKDLQEIARRGMSPEKPGGRKK